MTFQNRADGQEKRRFERYDTTWDAVATFEHGATLLCMVRNFTIAGAFVEFADEPPTDLRFRLTLERFGFETGCEVRRSFGKALGVTFFDALPSKLVAVNAAARRGEKACSVEVPSTAQEMPLTQLAAMLDQLSEFKESGFQARADRAGRSLQVMRGASIRGAWLIAPSGLKWRPTSGTGAMEVETAADAARATMLMVLNSVILRRATASVNAVSPGSPAEPRAALTRT